MHIINNTINGSQFSDATIDGSVLESKTLIQSDIANDAVVAGKFSNSINIDGKTSSSANIARAKLIDDAVTAEKLSFVFDADDTSKIASDAVTDGKLASNQLFDTTKVQDGSIKLDKIATGQLSSFASNTLTAADFDKDSSSDNIKIGRKQIKAGNKIKKKQITTAKIKTDSALPNASLSDSASKTLILPMIVFLVEISKMVPLPQSNWLILTSVAPACLNLTVTSLKH